MNNNLTLDISTYKRGSKLSDYEKETMIYKLANDLEKKNKQIILLTQNNIKLRKTLLDYNQLKEQLKSYEDVLKQKEEEKLEIIKQKDEQNSKLFNKISFLENTVEINGINYEKNNLLYSQKMSIFNQLQKENEIYKEEKDILEKEKKLIEKKKEDDLTRYQVRSDLKYKKFKKKMDEDIQKLNQNLINANSDYISANHRLVILQNKQLLLFIERLEKRIQELEKKNEKLKNKIFEYENDLNTQKLIEQDLTKKMGAKKIIRLTRNRTIINTTSYDNNNNNFMDTFSFGMNHSQIFEKKITEYKKQIEKQKNENDKLVLTNTYLKSKLNLYQTKYKGLFNFLEEALNNFCMDEDIINNNNFYINIDKIKNCDFSSFSRQEKYALLILLMKYLLPLININFNSSSNIGKNLFKTNLNIFNKKFDLKDHFFNDETLKIAFVDKKNKFFKDICTPLRTKFSSSVPVMKQIKTNYFDLFDKNNQILI